MKKYIGTKEVSVTPAWKVGSMVYPKDGAVPRTMNREDGYKVVYEDGYESWSPKNVFEKSYQLADTFLDRLYIELKDLGNKQDKLGKFIKSEAFNNLSQNKQELLNSQYKTMMKYLNILVKRIQLEECENVTE